MTASRSTSKSKKKIAYYHCVRGKHLRIRAEKVEEGFVALLDRLTPTPEYMDALKGIFRRVWEDRRASSATDVEAMRSELKRLEKQKDRILDEMKNGRLAGEDFSRMYDPLKIEIANVEDRLTLALGDELDVDTALSYLESCFWNTSPLWQAEDIDGKQRLQKLIFPAGIAWNREKGGFGTPKIHSIFTLFAGFGDGAPDDAVLVAPQGFKHTLFSMV